MTPAEAQAYELQAAYERDNRRIEQYDAIFTARDTCSAAGMVWYTDQFNASETRRMDRHPDWLPKRARRMDFSCFTQGEMNQILRRIVGIY